jgi:hypothetical protein
MAMHAGHVKYAFVRGYVVVEEMEQIVLWF